jgi:uncharacterized RDD family membrane protein YckC
MWILVLGLPFIFIEVKLGLGVLILVFTHINSTEKSSTFDLYCLLIIGLNFFFLFYPYSTNEYNPYSFQFLFPLHIVFVAFWWVFLRRSTQFDLNKISSAAILAAWFSWTFAMAQLLEGFGVVPFKVPDPYDYVNVNTDSFKLASNFVSALLFTAPILSYRYLKSRSPIKISLLAIFWIGILATGRRSAFFGLFICVLFLAYENLRTIKSFAMFILGFAFLVGASAVLYKFNVFSIAQMIDERFDSFNVFDENIRIDQAIALWEGFLDKPFFGHGLGTNVAIIRDDEKIWRYELSYIAAFYRYGVFGCMAYISLYGYPIWKNIVRFKSFSVEQKSVMVAVIAQVFTYSVNPTLDSFDTCWQILIPILMLEKIQQHRLPNKFGGNRNLIGHSVPGIL